MIEELERLARDCPSDWSAAADLASYVVGVEPSRYIAACSPDRVLRLLEVVKQAKALLEPMDECREIARRWEPDDSSGKERQWLVRGRYAAKALRAALAGLAETQDIDKERN